MVRNRPGGALRDLARGPGCVCAAFGIGRDLSGVDLTHDRRAVARTQAGPGGRHPGRDPHRSVARPAPATQIPRARQPFRQRSAIMRAMLRVRLAVPAAARAGVARVAADPPLTEDDFRKSMGFAPTLRMAYRNLACEPVSSMRSRGQMYAGRRARRHGSLRRWRRRSRLRCAGAAAPRCPSPYPPITAMPEFDLRDLAGKRVTSASLKGKPTL